MKALILTSNSLRHRYFARVVARRFDAPTALLEEKKAYYAQQRNHFHLVRAHFDRIADAENHWFADAGDLK